MKRLASLALVFTCGLCSSAFGQTAPEIGYVYPAGGQAGVARDVVLGGYDWTPDMQLFPHAPGVGMTITGAPSRVLVPLPPYWFGYKARGSDKPCAREFPANLTLGADLKPGIHKWQAANANGAAPPGFFHVSRYPSVLDETDRTETQKIASLPVVIDGQIRRIEEIDRYEFSVPQSGPVVIELIAKRVLSPLHAMVQVRDPSGRVVLDVADVEGRDFVRWFPAEANVPYTLSVNDVDFAGDRCYVYRLEVTAGPRVLAAFPASGQRGTTRLVEFHGVGVATGAAALETVARDVAFGADPGDSFVHRFDTPKGPVEFSLGLSNASENVEAPGASETAVPGLPYAVTGSIEQPKGADSYVVNLKPAEPVRITASSRSVDTILDLDLTVLGPDGKELATIDDAPGTLDPVLLFTAPAEGAYRVVVSDRGAKAGQRHANYRLEIAAPPKEFVVGAATPLQLSLPLGAATKIPLNIVRSGGVTGPVAVTFEGLPAGVPAPPDLKIPENANDLAVDLTCAADAAATAAMTTVKFNGATADGQAIAREHKVLLAITMKRRIKITPEGLDDVRKVHRGSTFLGPVFIDRLEGYVGPVTLEPTSKQQRHRQGLDGDELVVPADVRRYEYPIFVPEWMETTKTSRMILNGTVQVPDPKGNVRTLLQRMELRIGVLPEGALMKLSGPSEVMVKRGQTVEIELNMTRAPEYKDPATIELIREVSPSAWRDPALLVCEPIDADKEGRHVVKLKIADDPRLKGEGAIRFRAKALQYGKWPVITETTLDLVFED